LGVRLKKRFYQAVVAAAFIAGVQMSDKPVVKQVRDFVRENGPKVVKMLTGTYNSATGARYHNAAERDEKLPPLYSEAALEAYRNQGRRAAASPASARFRKEPIVLPGITDDAFPENASFTRAQMVGDNVCYYGSDNQATCKLSDRPGPGRASRAWLNNNPGNIIYGSFARDNGAIASDGRFAIFPSPGTGLAAQRRLLLTEQYQNLTLAGALRRYAPPKDNNDTNAYINYVSRETGISRTTLLKDLTNEQLDSLINAMIAFEGWYPGGISVGNRWTPVPPG
jgi:hypothetical protein